MPIPEPSRFKPSNLTKEQRQSELAAMYGVSMEQFTAAEIARMKEIVKDHEAQMSPVKTMDLNNPATPPYRHQEFPKMLYNLEASKPGGIVCIVVRSQVEMEDALADGYSLEAPPFGNTKATPEENISGKYAQEASQVQQTLEATRRGPGRPAKTA